MKRILIVDEEPRAIASFVQVLDSLPEGWSITFARSDVEALAQMDEKGCGICLSVVKSEHIDAASLLPQIKARHPSAMRFLLRDGPHTDKQSVPGIEAHGSFSHHGSRSTLERTLARQCAIQDAVQSPEMDQLLDRIEALPSVPSLYLEFTHATNDPQSTVESLGSIIARDMALTAKVLQIANSPQFGAMQRIVSPGQAATILGLDLLRSLVLSVKAFDAFSESRLAPKAIQSVWEHSLMVAQFARAILECERCDRTLVEEGFLAGMLHESGELVLAASRPDRFAAARVLAERDGSSITSLERRLFGISHDCLGANLLARWGMPTSVVEAVAFHHGPGQLTGNDFTPLVAVHVADQLATIDLARATVESIPGLDRDFLRRIGREARIERWLQACRETATDAGSTAR